ncbi:MAG: pilus assembly protein [Alphaproteobacteria bacterium]|nr:MAG: pilus assembly protein [Alphaproteobacteria bacterium]
MPQAHNTRASRPASRCGFWKNQKGIAAVEFALVVPIVVTLMLGGFELARCLLLHQKIERTSYTIADIIAQSDQVTSASLGQTLIAAPEIMDPFEFGAKGVVIITSVYRAQGQANATVRWRYTGGGTLARTSKLGNINATAALPNGLTLNEKDNVIVAEVYYDYQTFFASDIITPGDIYKTAIFKPRLGALITAP